MAPRLLKPLLILFLEALLPLASLAQTNPADRAGRACPAALPPAADSTPAAVAGGERGEKTASGESCQPLPQDPAVCRDLDSCPAQPDPLTSGPNGENVPPAAQTPAQNPPAAQAVPAGTPPPQPKRILGVMPNFRAVSAGAIPPPPTPKQSFMLATRNSFDYSSFIFVGFTSALAEWTNAHKQLGQGMPGFGRYYWRGFLDKTDGNYWVIFILPTAFHQDQRYYAVGKGGFWKRFGYSTTRVVVTRNYDGQNTFNISELLGRGIAQAISVTYYPTQTRTAGAIAAKYGYAILRDAVTNAFREFWPDIATHVLHQHAAAAPAPAGE